MRDRLDKLSVELAKHVENMVFFDVTDSTHALARRIIAEMDEESQKLGATLILADCQEEGEGRGDRSWKSPPMPGETTTDHSSKRWARWPTR